MTSGRPRHQPNRRALAASLLLAATSITTMPGCLPWEVVLVPAAGVAGGMTSATIATSLILAADPATGPNVAFRNDADVPVQIRYWVGRMDITAPNGVADLRSPPDHAVIVEPGEPYTIRVGVRPGYNVAGADSVVYVRIDPADHVVLPEGEVEKLWEGSDQPQWFEITRPLPFAWRVVGTTGDLRAERLGEHGALMPLPPEQWIDSNQGEFPVYAARDANAPVDEAGAG